MDPCHRVIAARESLASAEAMLGHDHPERDWRREKAHIRSASDTRATSDEEDQARLDDLGRRMGKSADVGCRSIGGVTVRRQLAIAICALGT